MTDISQPEVEDSRATEEQLKQAKRTSPIKQSPKSGTTFRAMRVNPNPCPKMSRRRSTNQLDKRRQRNRRKRVQKEKKRNKSSKSSKSNKGNPK
jgi:hypothetical protein